MKHRKLFPASESNGTTTSCSDYCDPNCAYNYNCLPFPDIYYPSEPPPPPPRQGHSLSPYVYIVIAVVVSFFLFLAYYLVVTRNGGGCSSDNNSGHQQGQSDDDDDDEDLLGQNRIDHPVWLIHTVGLQQSVINSITVCNYKKGEGLIEGSDCSVCLNEFQEDETVRLLPKCNHAFHISCIDTWLRSHINCPMCRAHIVHETAAASLDQNLENATLAVDGHAENSRIGRELGERNPEDNSESRRETEAADRILKPLQSMRRSVSLDSSLAETICLDLADFGVTEPGQFSTGDQILTDAEKSHSGSHSNSESNSVAGVKPDGAYSSSFRVMGNCSVLQNIDKVSVSMKRSFSCSGRFLSSRNNSSRNLNAILPL